MGHRMSLAEAFSPSVSQRPHLVACPPSLEVRLPNLQASPDNQNESTGTVGLNDASEDETAPLDHILDTMVGVLHLANGFLQCAVMVVANEATRNSRHEERHNEVTPTIASPSMCDARTINHITHTLPQLCLTRAWTSAALNYNGTTVSATSAPDGHSNGRQSSSMDSNAITSAPSTNSSTACHTSASTAAEAEAEAPPEAETEVEIEAASETEAEWASFMSFEDWKEMMLRQTGQNPQDLRSRRAAGSQDDRGEPPEIGDFGLGEEDEISLDFENYLNQANRDSYRASKDSVEGTSGNDAVDMLPYEGDKASLHRSKDAGKTCKERFSYSSFDAGATILKTGRGTKNAKAILIENKDSYMLLECGAESKYVIVELSDDILIDTVVLANFEFFSSMIRQFHVSVSDRYPVKVDRWKEVGIFEARNSRDIQAFLVENPQIWAKYVRIEFQTHYGNEYYCPVSLLRIHGSRMLDSWKDMDGGREEEISIDEDEAGTMEKLTDTPIPGIDVGTVDKVETVSEPELDFTPWVIFPFANVCDVCPKMTSNEEGLAKATKESKAGRNERSSADPISACNGDTPTSSTIKTPITSSSTDQGPSPISNLTFTQDMVSLGGSLAKTVESSTASSIANTTLSTESSSPPTKASGSSSPGQRVRASGTMGTPAASPTVQEGFFNAITKRLHHAEVNLTLTMQYLEDHSRYVQESLQKAEQKQLSKVTAFLDNLNQTVLAELRGMRDQYDQIWQSTIFALETQREQADRDIVALSSRLNLLADEVVFQKRMAIVQAILLLCCLFLVIFSRGVPIPYLAPLLDQAGASMPGAPPNLLDLSTRPLYTSQSRQDEAENHQLDSSWSCNPPNDSGISSASAPRGMPVAPRLVRLSPPLTPSFEAPNPSVADTSSSDCDLDGPLMHRLTAHYPHTNQSRKPLPALPEHPSSERSPSS